MYLSVHLLKGVFQYVAIRVLPNTLLRNRPLEMCREGSGALLHVVPCMENLLDGIHACQDIFPRRCCFLRIDKR